MDGAGADVVVVARVGEVVRGVVEGALAGWEVAVLLLLLLLSRSRCF